MVLLKRHYNLRKRNHRGGTTRRIEKQRRIPTLRQSNHRKGKNVRPTKMPTASPPPRKRQTGRARMKKKQLEREYEIECKQRALVNREQALARMERAIARRERALRLWEKTNGDAQANVVSRTENKTSPSKKCPRRKANSATDPEVMIIRHFDCAHPKPVPPTIDLTASGGQRKASGGRHNVSKVRPNVNKVRHNVSEVKHNVSKVRRNVSKERRNVREVRHNASEVRHNVNEVRHNVSEVRHNASEVRHNVRGGRQRACTEKSANTVGGEAGRNVKPPSDTMFSGQGSKLQWQKSPIFPMDNNVDWKRQRSPTQNVKTETVTP